MTIRNLATGSRARTEEKSELDPRSACLRVPRSADRWRTPTREQRLANANAIRRAAAKVAEGVLATLPTGAAGTLSVKPEQFRALVRFLFEGEPVKAKRATRSDRFTVSGLQFVCNRELNVANTMQLAAFARARGLPHPTVSRHVAKAGLKHIVRFGKKRYAIEDLDALPFMHRC